MADGTLSTAGAATRPAPAAAAVAVRTTCPYCGVGCGVLATSESDGSVSIAGDREHPANFGRLCVKGAALGETVALDGRLLQPTRRNADGGLEPIGWDAALDEVVARFSAAIAEHGPDSVAFYVSGQLLTEDYYVANKLMKGYIGSANIDTNSRLCMSSAVAAHKRAFGEDYVPVSYEDLEAADLIVLVGSNTAWCHPVIWQRIVAARKARPEVRIIVVDPRRTTTADEADVHLAIRPGSDVWLFNGLIAWLARHERLAPGVDVSALLDAAVNTDPDAVAAACGISVAQLTAFYAEWTGSERVVTAFSQGVNQSSAGADKGSTIINCHIASGRLDRPGMGPFSITGQPNAMGGREVGGLANQLAAHLDLEVEVHRDLVQKFWNSPVMADHAGYKAVDLFEAVHDGRIKALWIVATNPVVSLPDADRVREALQRCDFVVVSDVNARTDTSDLAHLLLPATAWGEKDGTVTNSERRISRQRAFLPAPGEAKPDWWAMAEVGRRMGFSGFDYRNARDIFVEHCALTAVDNTTDGIPRRLDLGALVALDDAAYDALAPIRWPQPAVAPADMPPAKMLAIAPRAPRHAPDAEFSLVLNTGRVRDQWHTMSRTGRAPRLATHVPEPFLEIHPDDASALALIDGGLARVVSRWGHCVVRATVTDRVSAGQVFVPIHWNGRTAADARVGAVVNPVVDPVSGEPEFKHTPVRVEAVATRWSGFALSRAALDLRRDGAAADYWARLQGRGFEHFELAGCDALDDPRAFARTLLQVGADADYIEVEDPAAGRYRAAWFVDRRLAGVVQFAPTREQLPSRDWLGSQFAEDLIDSRGRLAVLAGRAPGAVMDPGPTVCSCYGVGRNVITKAIKEQGLRTPEELGARLRCGTNCGSCIPELRNLIATTP